MNISISFTFLLLSGNRRATKAGLRVKTDKCHSEITVVFIDSGNPFNPLEKEEPDVTLPARQRKVGGLGIHIVKSSMDEVSYEYKDGQNILTISKRINT